MTIAGDAISTDAVPSTERPDRLQKRVRRLAPYLVVALLAQMALAMLLGAAKDAPTFDETTHIASGILNVRDRDLRWNAEHPPLTKVLAGLATLGSNVRIPTDTAAYREGEEVDFARALLYENGNDANHLIWLARLPFILLTLLFGLIVYGFARDLFGQSGALVGLALYSFCPTVLAHGRLVHADMPLAGFLLATAWFLWRASTRGSRWFAPACIVFGLALLTKFTALLALPPVLLLAFWTRFARDGVTRARLARGALRAIVMLASSVAIVWAGYLAVSPRLRFETTYYDFWGSKAQGMTAQVVDALPLPRAYRAGLRFTTTYDQQSLHPAFLFGRAYRGGDAAFFPLSLVSKTPIGSLALWALGAGALLQARKKRALAFLALIPLGLLAFSVMSNTNIGIRHVAVVPVFAAVVAGGVTLQFENRRIMIATGLLLAFAAVSVWLSFPSHIAYTNESFGGMAAAPKRFADSNVDWGQDLRRLADHIALHPEHRPDWILYFGSPPPSGYGIGARDITNAPRDSVHGLAAVSVSWLNLEPEKWSWLVEGRQPIARVGPSILLYRIP
ncbi:MAG: glycosyltransferase family 39 protein [Actinomycetota bacterium]